MENYFRPLEFDKMAVIMKNMDKSSLNFHSSEVLTMGNSTFHVVRLVINC